MKLIFSINKYREWRKEHDHLDDETIEFIINNHSMQIDDGVDRDVLMCKGHIILEAWCDEQE